MSVGTRTETGRPARRVHNAEQVKRGAAQRAYQRRRRRGGPPPTPAGSGLAGRGPFVAVILAMFGCGLVLTLVLTTRAAEDSYQLGDAREANRVLSNERAALQREVASADSAPELATRARELGMVPADDPARLVVAPDGTVTVVGEPVPAHGPAAPPLNSPPRTGPQDGADPGERIVPVPSPPRADDTERPGPAEAPTVPPAETSVLAAPGPAPAPPLPGSDTVPAPGQPPLGTAPGPDAGTAPGAEAPAEGATPAAPGDSAVPPENRAVPPAPPQSAAPGVGADGQVPPEGVAGGPGPGPDIGAGMQ